MYLLLLIAVLIVAYWLGFIGIPVPLVQTVPGVLTQAESKFPRYRGFEAVRMLAITGLGMAGDIAAIVSIIWMLASWLRG